MNSALTFRDFIPRLELLTLCRDFQKCVKMYEMKYFSLFCKSHLVLFLTFITGTPVFAAPRRVARRGDGGNGHGWRNLFQSGRHKCTLKNYRNVLRFELAM